MDSVKVIDDENTYTLVLNTVDAAAPVSSGLSIKYTWQAQWNLLFGQAFTDQSTFLVTHTYIGLYEQTANQAGATFTNPNNWPNTPSSTPFLIEANFARQTLRSDGNVSCINVADLRDFNSGSTTSYQFGLWRFKAAESQFIAKDLMYRNTIEITCRPVGISVGGNNYPALSDSVTAGIHIFTFKLLRDET